MSSPGPLSESRPQFLPYLAFAGLGLIWGASFLFIKLGVQDMSPTVVVLIRSASGAAALAAIMLLTRRSLVGPGLRGRLFPFGFIALFNAPSPWVPAPRP